MKAVLVNPFQIRLVGKKGRIYNRTWTPLDLATSASILRAEGHDVSIVDANAEQLTSEATADRCAGADIVFITSTSLDRWQCPHLDLVPFLETTEAIRRKVSRLVVMGSHGTVLPVEILKQTQAEAVVQGEPEGAIQEIAKGALLSAVAGVTWNGPDGPVSNPPGKGVRMDELPLPALDLLPMHLYEYEVMGNAFTLFEMSRGCASECTFCLLDTYGNGVRKQSVDRLTREIEVAVTQFGVRTAYFIDLEFTVLRKQVMELCDWLIERKLPLTWCCQTRFDLVDAEVLEKMKRAGCTLIHFGVEAGSDRMLSKVNKGITMDAIRRGMALTKESGIRSACFFMIGFPESTQEDMVDIEEFAKELAPDYPLFHIAAPYPGTELHEQVKKDTSLRFSDDSLFPEAVEGRFSLADWKRMTRRAYIHYYARPSYVAGRLIKGDFRSLWRQAKLFYNLVTA